MLIFLVELSTVYHDRWMHFLIRHKCMLFHHQPWCNSQWLTGLKTPTNQQNYFIISVTKALVTYRAKKMTVPSCACIVHSSVTRIMQWTSWAHLWHEDYRFSMDTWCDANTRNQKTKLAVHFYITAKKSSFSTSPHFFIISGKIVGSYGPFSNCCQL